MSEEEKAKKLGETKAKYGARRRKRAPKEWDPGDPWQHPTIEQVIARQGSKVFKAENFKDLDIFPQDEDIIKFIEAAKGRPYRPIR